jgi:hypothetical protein
MSRRRRRPFPFSPLQGQTATQNVESGLLPQCQKWALRALIVDFHANLTPVFHSILTPPVAV